MNHLSVITEILHGDHKKARTAIKKMTVPKRLELMFQCMPYLHMTPAIHNFFKDNLAKEVVALKQSFHTPEMRELMAANFQRAEDIYRSLKEVDITKPLTDEEKRAVGIMDDDGDDEYEDDY
jgi:hypothetical protein